MIELPAGSKSFFVELHEYSMEEVATRLKADEATVVETISGLVTQGLATTSKKPNHTANKPQTLVTFQFVGVASFGNIVLRCLPKFFKQEECTTQALEQVIKAIFKQRSSLVTPYSRQEDSLGSIQSAMDEAVFFVADYLQNGGYPAKPIVREGAEMGDIDWERTLNERTPWLTGNTAIYFDPVSTYADNDTEDFCRKLHLAIVSDCFRFLKSTGTAELIGIGAWPPSDMKLADFGSPSYVLARLRAEKQIQFDDRRLQLLRLMESHLERSMSLRSFENFGFFGTSHFEIVWETLCSYAFKSQRDMPISQCLDEAKLPKKSTALTTNSTLIELIERPKWRIDDEGKSFEQRSQGRLTPDALLIHEADNRFLAILDAKYYALSSSGQRLTNQPGIEDIVKQHAYQMALQDFADANDLTIQNALLFPTSERTRVIGMVQYDVLSDFTNNRLSPIAIVLVNMGSVIDFYTTDNPEWEATANAVLREL